MINLIDDVRRSRRTSHRLSVEKVGLAAVSVTCAAVLLPAICLHAIATSLTFARKAQAPADVEHSYLIT